mgnify:CR=1 FL=1
MNDKDLEILSNAMDELLVRTCIQHKVSPLILSSVLLARLMHLNEAAHSMDDYKQLLVEVGTGVVGEDEDYDRVIH